MEEEVSKAEPGRKRCTPGGFQLLRTISRVLLRNSFINEPPELQGERRKSVINYDPSEKHPELGQSGEEGVCCFGVLTCGRSSGH